jgi:hypothetical protein
MHRDLGPWDAMSVGMFLQTLLLALTERGLGSCVEVSIVGYPEIVRAELDIPEELSILCGLALGYSDPDFAANKLKIGREPVGENVVFLDSWAGGLMSCRLAVAARASRSSSAWPSRLSRRRSGRRVPLGARDSDVRRRVFQGRRRAGIAVF